ncbi:MAG TPA: prepilin-type N-terminal cleavage/methylation domain-containing protein [Burkholderiales bacterium]|nr:prepilin-type N-terminal cleavage/methylation domain-containing protein [Burkholderiales bacterium]
MRKQSGFTLIEIAIVLVIIGLLLGGVLKGQELITSARVRNIITQQDGIKAAYFGFLDRFRSLPGDYALASTNINCTPTCTNGNGNGQITPNGVAGATIDEHIAAWEHLSKSGFINGSYTYAAVPETTASALTNPYVRYVQLIYDNSYGVGGLVSRHNIKTGNQVPSDILAEIDRKIDDGNPIGGIFQFSPYNGGAGGTSPTGGAVGTCYTAGPPPAWSAPPVTNCGGTSLL